MVGTCSTRTNVSASTRRSRAVTIDAAWQCGADAVTGSLEIGKYADLVVLEDDPWAVDPGAIASIGVSETRLAGVVTHSA